MLYGLLKYKESKKRFNLGDNIQSLAARQFLPQVDALLNRETLAYYKGDPIKVIMNGWFTHNIDNWVPSDAIEPLFVSFHINNTAAPYMLSENGIAYLKKYQPIGCRDQYTTDTLRSKGIEAYFTGCLTLTLNQFKVDDAQRTDEIFIVDPLNSYPTAAKITYDYRRFLRSIQNGKIFQLGKRRRHLKQLIDENLWKNAIHIDQEPPANTYTDEEKLVMAEEVLKKYARAKLVITSRIHCALPCLAMGTPVIFINGFESYDDSCRFDGILELFNRVDVNTYTGAFSSNFGLEGKITKDTKVKNNPDYVKLADSLRQKCREFTGFKNA